MRALVLWADDASPNLGVRVLAQGSAALVRTVWPEADVAFQNYGRGAAPLPITTLKSLARERVTHDKGLQRWLTEFELVVDTRSGDSFSDIYGLRRLTMQSALAACAAQAGVPVVLGPQTLGPFGTRPGALLGRAAMHRATLVMARDSASKAYAVQLGGRVDVLTTDVVFALPVPAVERTRDVLLNISGLLWRDSPHVNGARYRATVAGVHDALVAAGRKVSLLAHVLPSRHPDNDLPAIEEFASGRSTAPEILVPSDVREVRELVASAHVVIGSRMHACLNALSVGTPALPLAYSRKFAPLLADLGWTATVDLRTDVAPVDSVLRHLADPELANKAVGVRAAGRAALLRATSALRELS